MSGFFPPIKLTKLRNDSWQMKAYFIIRLQLDGLEMISDEDTYTLPLTTYFFALRPFASDFIGILLTHLYWSARSSYQVVVTQCYSKLCASTDEPAAKWWPQYAFAFKT